MQFDLSAKQQVYTYYIASCYRLSFESFQEIVNYVT